MSVDEAVEAGMLTATIESFAAIPVPGVPGTPFHGEADLVIENVSMENVEFVLMEGAVFQLIGADAQAIISHQNPVEPPTLPPTGSSSWANPGLMVVMPIAAGLMLLLGGIAQRRAAR